MADLLIVSLVLAFLSLVTWLYPAVIAVGLAILAAAVLVGAVIWWRDSRRKAPLNPKS